MTTNDLLTATPLAEALNEAIDLIIGEYCSHCAPCGSENPTCFARVQYKALAESEIIAKHSEALWRVLKLLEPLKEYQKKDIQGCITVAERYKADHEYIRLCDELDIAWGALPPELIDVIKQRGGE